MNCSEFKQLLDSFIDGEMDAQQAEAFRAHAVECMSCGEQLKAAEQLRDILSQMDENIAVPLPAQASWRSAVRKEAARRRMKRIYTAVGAVAAVCVLTVGVTGVLRAQDAPVPGNEAVQQVAYVETDGVSEGSVLEASKAPGQARMVSADAPYAQRKIYVEDAAAARSYLEDITAEYGGIIEREANVGSGVKVYVRISGENASDFISAVDHIGTPEAASFAYDSAADSVGICVLIAAE